MQNFVFNNPVKIIFGKGTVSKLGKEAASCGKKALLVYGGGSIKRNGVYQAVTDSLAKSGISYIEHGGVKPNPILSHTREGIKKAVENGCDLIIAAGGGSVIDEAKAIAAGARYNGDVWDFFIGKAKIGAALPLVTVLTIPATGSEMNSGFVITNEAQKEKYAAGSPSSFPKVSILDPETTMSLPMEQVAYGAVDALAHIMEGYFTTTDTNNQMTDELVHAIARSVINSTEGILKDPKDYNDRAAMMWSATLALNGLQTLGYKDIQFISHAIEHSLSAIYDIAHGAGLAIVLPAWLKYHLKNSGPERLEKFGQAIFGVKGAEATIKALEKWFSHIGAPTRLSDVRISASGIAEIAANAMRLITMWGITRYDQKTIEEILASAK